MSLYDKATIALIPSGFKAGSTDNLYSVLPANGNGDFNATRGSTATRVNKDGLIESVATNVPRLDYPVTSGVVGDCPHLLLEPSRTNIYPYSNQKVSGGLETFAVGTSSITVTNNYATSPDGSLNAMRMVATCGSTSSDQTGLRDALSMSAASATLSFFAKSNTSSAQTVAIHFNGGTKTVLTLTTDWQRFTYTDTSSTTNNAGVVIRGGSTDTSVDVLLFGFQMEQATYPTSYIPTENNASGVTRSADLCIDSGTSAEFNDSEGVLFAELQALDDLPSANSYVSLSDGSSVTNAVLIQYRNNGDLRLYNGGTITANMIFRDAGATLTDNLKIAIKYGTSTSDYKVYINGVNKTIETAFVATSMSGLDSLQFAYSNGTSSPFEGKCKQLIVFNEALSDSELATLTS